MFDENHPKSTSITPNKTMESHAIIRYLNSLDFKFRPQYFGLLLMKSFTYFTHKTTHNTRNPAHTNSTNIKNIISIQFSSISQNKELKDCKIYSFYSFDLDFKLS